MKNQEARGVTGLTISPGHFKGRTKGTGFGIWLDSPFSPATQELTVAHHLTSLGLNFLSSEVELRQQTSECC